MKSKRGITFLATAMTMIMMAIPVFADTSFSSIGTVRVPAFNGSAYSASQHKTYTTSQWANLKINTVTNGVNLDVRTVNNTTKKNGLWIRDQTSNSMSTPGYASGSQAGDVVKIEFSNDLNTGFTVAVTGSWQSN